MHCPFRIICISSIPARSVCARRNDLNPSIGGSSTGPLYHFHKPKDEEEANLWLRRALVTYNNGEHRTGSHARIEDWLRHLPPDGVRAMCSWERFCAFAREPERRTVAGDATVSVEGAAYEVEPELAGETVTLLWGLFDQELFVEHQGKRFGPFQPSRGAVPLFRYRKYQKSRTEERSALAGRASPLRGSYGLHAQSPALYSAPCIFRALQSCFSPPMMAGTSSSKNSATPSARGPASALSACSPAAPPPWASAATAVPRRVAPIPVSSARAVAQKPAAVADLKPQSSGLRNRRISSPTATGSTSRLPCLTCTGPSSVTTGRC